MSGVRWSYEEYEAYLARKNRVAVQVANVERNPSHAATPEITAKEVYKRVRITVHHRSRRLADATGRSHKAAVDGLVRGGILIDDSPKYVAEIRETFEKGKDQTIIEIEEL